MPGSGGRRPSQPTGSMHSSRQPAFRCHAEGGSCGVMVGSQHPRGQATFAVCEQKQRCRNPEREKKAGGRPLYLRVVALSLSLSPLVCASSPSPGGEKGDMVGIFSVPDTGPAAQEGRKRKREALIPVGGASTGGRQRCGAPTSHRSTPWEAAKCFVASGTSKGSCYQPSRHRVADLWPRVTVPRKRWPKNHLRAASSFEETQTGARLCVCGGW
jgi:hypothetical protein